MRKPGCSVCWGLRATCRCSLPVRRVGTNLLKSFLFRTRLIFRLSPWVQSLPVALSPVSVGSGAEPCRTETKSFPRCTPQPSASAAPLACPGEPRAQGPPSWRADCPGHVVPAGAPRCGCRVGGGELTPRRGARRSCHVSGCRESAASCSAYRAARRGPGLAQGGRSSLIPRGSDTAGHGVRAELLRTAAPSPCSSPERGHKGSGARAQSSHCSACCACSPGGARRSFSDPAPLLAGPAGILLSSLGALSWLSQAGRSWWLPRGRQLR